MPFSILTKVGVLLALSVTLLAQNKTPLPTKTPPPMRVRNEDMPTLTLEEKVDIQQPASKIWTIISQFDKLKWIPLVNQVTYSFDPKKNKAFRRVTTKNGWSLGEMRTLEDPKNRVLKFEVIDFRDPEQSIVRPFKRALTQIKVIPLTPKTSQVIWKTEVNYDLQHPEAQNPNFSLDQIKFIFETTIRSGLENLRLMSPNQQY